MIDTLINVAHLQDSNNVISKKGVCLKDLKNYGVARNETPNDLYNLRKQGYLSVECVSYPRGMKRHYYRLTIKGKHKLELPLTLRDFIYLKVLGQ